MTEFEKLTRELLRIKKFQEKIKGEDFLEERMRELEKAMQIFQILDIDTEYGSIGFKNEYKLKYSEKELVLVPACFLYYMYLGRINDTYQMIFQKKVNPPTNFKFRVTCRVSKIQDHYFLYLITRQEQLKNYLEEKMQSYDGKEEEIVNVLKKLSNKVKQLKTRISENSWKIVLNHSNFEPLEMVVQKEEQVDLIPICKRISYWYGDVYSTYLEAIKIMESKKREYDSLTVEMVQLENIMLKLFYFQLT